MTVYTVARHKARLDAAFARVSGVSDLELQADFARYLCILVSGFMEQAVRQTYSAYAEQRSSDEVTRYVDSHLDRFSNANAARLLRLANRFSRQWHDDLADFLEGERKDAIDSVVANRHNISHGRDVGITYIRIRDYYAKVKEIVAFIEQQCQ